MSRVKNIIASRLDMSEIQMKPVSFNQQTHKSELQGIYPNLFKLQNQSVANAKVRSSQMERLSAEAMGLSIERNVLGVNELI